MLQRLQELRVHECCVPWESLANLPLGLTKLALTPANGIVPCALIMTLETVRRLLQLAQLRHLSIGYHVGSRRNSGAVTELDPMLLRGLMSLTHPRVGT